MLITTVIVSGNRSNNAFHDWPEEQGLSSEAEDKGSATSL